MCFGMGMGWAEQDRQMKLRHKGITVQWLLGDSGGSNFSSISPTLMPEETVL